MTASLEFQKTWPWSCLCHCHCLLVGPICQRWKIFVWLWLTSTGWLCCLFWLWSRQVDLRIGRPVTVVLATCCEQKLWVLAIWPSLIKTQAARLCSCPAHAQLMHILMRLMEFCGNLYTNCSLMPHPHLSLAQQITLEFERGAETAASAVVR